MGEKGRTARQDWLKWNEFQKWQSELRKAAEDGNEDALKIAEQVCEPRDLIPIKQDYRKKHASRRRIAHTTWHRKPINGYSQRHSDIARHVMGLKYAGEAMKEAFESAAGKYEMEPHSVETLYYRKTELFNLAEMELLESAMKEYHQNLWICRTALSQAGPIAVDTLTEILKNKDASDSVKSKSAIAVLKMLDVDGSANANPSEKIVLESLKVVKQSMQNIQKGAESHIIDAEDAEIVEEDASESRADSQL